MLSKFSNVTLAKLYTLAGQVFTHLPGEGLWFCQSWPRATMNLKFPKFLSYWPKGYDSKNANDTDTLFLFS